MTLATTDRSRIDEIPVSHLAFHDGGCCAETRQLILARLQQYPDVGSQLAAVPATFRWGPTRWPAYWCDLLRKKELVADCGVHAELASALLWDAGIEHARGRAAIHAGQVATAHWNAGWTCEGASCAWIGEEIVHHEVLRVGDRWWDATEARWFGGPGAALIAGLVVAVRAEGEDWQTLT
jgi:hypothetical protein